MLRYLLCLSATLWAAHARYFGNYECDGGRDVVVHLFEWPWDDIAAACPRLAEIGYCAVQVSPPQEHITGGGGEWWQRYQPVSYIVTSRSGNEGQFQNMVNTCNAAGVKIYVDAIINHMTGGGSGTGTAGSFWDGGGDSGQSYPGVPFGENDFNGRDMCFTGNMEIGNYQDPNEVRNCRLSGLRDLRLGADYPRDMVRGYMQKVVDWGVAGFRVDAAKHMWPGDMAAIFDPLNGTPFIVQEVIDQGGEPITAGEYTDIARVTEFRFGLKLGEIVLKENGQMLSYLHNFGEAWGFISGMSALSFVDNHDNQRGHGGGGNIITHKQAREYKIANAFMLAWNYGYPRVMSSYSFTNSESGPPGGSVECFNGQWVCEHDWRQIANMVRFHNAAVGEPVSNWWDNGGNAIAFGRGSKGFIVINNEDYGIGETFQTGLPAGEYCDVNSCDGNRSPCGGSECRGSINVDGGGWAFIDVSNDDNPVRAYHV